MAEPLLSIDALSGGYQDLVVVKGVSLGVGRGEAASVTGRNGVGKTTLMRLIAGSLPVTAGQLFFDGRPIADLPDHRRLRLGISYAPQENVVFDGLTVAENLTLHHPGEALGRYEDLFKRFPRLKERLSQRAGTLSGGEKKLLSFSRAIAEPTALVLLDEPTEGVQPDFIAAMAEVILAEKARGRSFLIVDQNLTFLEAFTDTIHLMDHGEQTYEASGRGFRDEIEARIRI